MENTACDHSEIHEYDIDDLCQLRKEVEELRQLLGDEAVDAAVAEEDWEKALEQERRQGEKSVRETARIIGENKRKLDSLLSFSSYPNKHVRYEGRVESSASKRKCLQAVQKALEANIKLQKRLERLITATNRAQDGVVDIREGVQEYIHRSMSETQAPRFHPSKKVLRESPGVSWFWALPNAPSPPLYPGSSETSLVSSVLPLSFQVTPWNSEDDEKLKEMILQRVQELEMTHVLNTLESQGNVLPSRLQELFETIQNSNINDQNTLDAVDGFSEQDWTTIAHRGRWLRGHYNRFCIERTAMECKLRWYHSLHPRICTEEFTEEEDDELLRLVEMHGEYDWTTIASELESTIRKSTSGTSFRTELACLTRYQQLKHRNKQSNEISEDGMKKIKNLISRHGPAWKRIAEEFGGGFTDMQLLHFWRRKEQRSQGGVQPRIGKWTADENELLLKAVALYGRKWTKVATLVPGRTDVQCRERYMNVLAPEVKNVGPFSPEEDQILRESVAKNTKQDGKVRWSGVAKDLPGRTDRQVSKRWNVISRRDPQISRNITSQDEERESKNTESLNQGKRKRKVKKM